MPIYLFECPQCGFIGEFVLPMSCCDSKQFCPDCQHSMKRIFTPPHINVGTGQWDYHDENLGYISTPSHKKRLMREQGVTQKGDTPKPNGDSWF